MSSFVPLLATSVTDIIKNSTCEEFKRKSFDKLKVNKIDEVQNEILSKLNKISEANLKIKQSSSKPPEVFKLIS